MGKQFNFEEGRYANAEEERLMQAKAKEEREYIAELNERIFKLHKALKERLSEEKKLKKSDD